MYSAALFWTAICGVCSRCLQIHTYVRTYVAAASPILGATLQVHAALPTLTCVSAYMYVHTYVHWNEKDIYIRTVSNWERVVLEYQLQNRVENLAKVSTRCSGLLQGEDLLHPEEGQSIWSKRRQGFQPCFEAGIRELPFLMPEPAEKPSLHLYQTVDTVCMQWTWTDAMFYAHIHVNTHSCVHFCSNCRFRYSICTDVSAWLVVALVDYLNWVSVKKHVLSTWVYVL